MVGSKHVSKLRFSSYRSISTSFVIHISKQSKAQTACLHSVEFGLLSNVVFYKVKYCGEDHMFIMDDDLVLVYRGQEVSRLDVVRCILAVRSQAFFVWRSVPAGHGR